MQQEVIKVSNLHRDFTVTEGIIRKLKKTVSALGGIDFSVQKGEIFGLLGPNGAGKTTTIKILTTLLLPSSGKAEVLGHDIAHRPQEIRPYINFIFGGERALYWRLSAEDNLKYFADLYKVDPKVQRQRIPELLELVGLSDRAKTKVETFSKGMKQRLHIARGLINDPKVIFLDEPTIGLDPEASLTMRHLIGQLKSQGKTILLTTHYMLEADVLCDRIGVINHGKIIALDTPEGLKHLTHGWATLELRVMGLSQDNFNGLKALPGIEFANLSTVEQSQILRLQTKNPDDIFRMTMDYLQIKGVQINNVMTGKASLEDAYLKLIGGAA